MDSRIQKERNFSKKYFDGNEYGNETLLIYYFITVFRYPDKWEKELLPMLHRLKIGEEPIDDWNGIIPIGDVCFRHQHVLFTSPTFNETHSQCLPLLRDDKGEPVLNHQWQWLFDTEKIIESEIFQDYAVISIVEFIQICEQWLIIIKNW